MGSPYKSYVGLVSPLSGLRIPLGIHLERPRGNAAELLREAECESTKEYTQAPNKECQPTITKPYTLNLNLKSCLNHKGHAVPTSPEPEFNIRAPSSATPTDSSIRCRFLF